MSPIFPVWNLSASSVCVQGLAMSTSRQLLCVQANREKCLHSVHVGGVSRLVGPQCSRAASPGMEALLQAALLL